jgi:uncharacterized radical SAM superfamily protein
VQLDTAIPEYLRPGWEIARKNFGSRVSFFAPSVKHYDTEDFSNCGTCSFNPISISGGECPLQCDHCKAEILKPMTPAKTPEDLRRAALSYYERGARGILISGGSRLDGVVPLNPYVPVIRELKEKYGMRILAHVGIPDEESVKGLKEAGIDSALMDVIGSEETMRKVYHLRNRTPKIYEDSMRLLAEYGVPVSPHVIIGLHYGKILGEYEALRIISQFPIASLVLVALLPLANTPMESVIPPSPEEMSQVFVAARVMLPTTPILLGCERPAGEHKKKTDLLAVKAGINGIAFPAEGIRESAEAMGLKTRFSGTCCSLLFEDIQREASTPNPPWQIPLRVLN